MLVPAGGERDVVGLQRVSIAGHVGPECGVHEPLDRRHAAKRGLQRDLHGAGGVELVADLPIGADIGAPEAIDRLLGIADDKERARPERRFVAFAREPPQQIGLQRIGVLELVDEQDAEAAAKLFADFGVVAHQVARLDQQIEKVERAGFLLARFVATQAVAHLFAKQRRQIGVGIVPELLEVDQELRVGRQRLIARDADGKCRAGSLARPGKVAIVGQRHQRGFPPVVGALGNHVADRATLPLDLDTGGAGGLGVDREVVALLERPRRHLRKILELLGQRLDVAMAIVRRPRPGRGVVAPLAEIARGPAQTLDRAVTLLLLRPPPHGPPKRSPDAVTRVRELLVQPGRERLVENAVGLCFGEDDEGRIDARFDRPLAQQLGAEAVNGADLRFFEVVDRRRQQRRFVRRHALRARAVSSSSRRRSFSSPAAFSLNVTATISPMRARGA